MFFHSKDLQQFNSHVGLKFQLYNSLFTALPFHRIEKTGIFLSLLLSHCEDGYQKSQSPSEIIESFFTRFIPGKSEDEKADLLFQFVQYVERQVVLFDALEDAAFEKVHDIDGVGSLKDLELAIKRSGSEEKLAAKLKDFLVRLVLTAHPTQFYPGSVLGIINDLSTALNDDNTEMVNMYLQQLGKTPFYNKQKPTPYDEAISLVWYLENVFYFAAGGIMSSLKKSFPGTVPSNNPVMAIGFWPGGDRDGNPNVTTEITLKVANALRGAIIKSYYRDVREIKRRLTFRGVDTILADLEQKLYQHIFVDENKLLKVEEIFKPLVQARKIIISDHNELFLGLVDGLICKLQVFGLYFASLDIRQESSVHNTVLEAISLKGQFLPRNYKDLNEDEKINVLTNVAGEPDLLTGHDGIVSDTINSVAAIKTIQERNGEFGCHRYIISQCHSALNVIEVYGLFHIKLS